MELNDFIDNFIDQLDETDGATINANTNFKELEEWSSLTALSIVGMIDDIYGVQLKGLDIRNSTTIQDLFNLVKSRI